MLSKTSGQTFLSNVMSKDELKTFLTIHIREGASQVVLLFMDELPTFKLPSVERGREQGRGRRDVKYTVIQFDVRHIHLFRSALTLLNSEE